MGVDDQGTTGKRSPTATEVGRRLQESLKRRGWTVQALLLRLVDNDVTIGQTAIYKYFRGEGRTPPPVDFLEDAARALNCRFAWLSIGDGERTEYEEDSRIEREIQAQGARQEAVGHGWTEALSVALEDELGHELPSVAHVFVAHHLRHDSNAALAIEGVTPEDVVRRLARSVAAPLKEFGIGFADLSASDQVDYVMGVFPALAIVGRTYVWKAKSDEFLKMILEERPAEGGKKGES